MPARTDEDAVSISVVIPAYRAWATLPQVLDALEPQMRRGREVIVVDSSGATPDNAVSHGRPWLRVVSLAERTWPGRGRNIGVGLSRGDILAFVDADAVPDPTWLDELEAALAPEIDAVGGAVLNGTPRSAIGTAGYLLEFSELLPERDSQLLHAATCNLLLRKRAFERLGGFAEDTATGEDTILTFGLGTSGKLMFAPRARVHHLNRTRLRDFLRSQHELGAGFARVCARVDFPHGWAGRPVAAPVAAPLRFVAVAKRVLRNPSQARRAVVVSPLILLGLGAWTVGLARAWRGDRHRR